MSKILHVLCTHSTPPNKAVIKILTSFIITNKTVYQHYLLN